MSHTPNNLASSPCCARYNIGGANQEHVQQYRPGAAVPCFVQPDGSYCWDVDAGQVAMLLGAAQLGADLFEAFVNSPPWHWTASGSSRWVVVVCCCGREGKRGTWRGVEQLHQSHATCLVMQQWRRHHSTSLQQPLLLPCLLCTTTTTGATSTLCAPTWTSSTSRPLQSSVQVMKRLA